MDVTTIVGIEIDSKEDAKAVHKALDHAADAGTFEIAEAALVYKNDKGHVKKEYYGLSGFGVGAVVGTAAGGGLAVAGVLGLINPIIGIGLLPGLIGGGFIGHFFERHFVGKDFLKDIGAGLDDGKGYVLVATDDAGAEAITSNPVASMHRVATIDVTPEFVEDLNAAAVEAASADA